MNKKKDRMFKGLFQSTGVSYHVYAVGDDGDSETQALLDLGLATYTVEDLKEYFKDESSPKDAMRVIELALGKDQGTIFVEDRLIGKVFDKAYYWKFDEKTGQYKEEEINQGTDLSSLAKSHDTIESNNGIVAANQEDDSAIIKAVQKSIDGCIHFKPYADATTELRLYFQSKDKRDNSRRMSINGDPLISAVPRTATGRRFHWSRTMQSRVPKRITDEDGNVLQTFTGSYKIQKRGEYSIDEDDNEAMVSSALRMFYNESLGCFESGSQVILAKLLQDIDPAPISEIDLSALDGLSPEDLYDPNSPYYMSQFTTGIAMPLSIHNANPHTFGPNIIDDKSNKKEKIRVVNRVARSFKQNDVVLCILIGSEWIILDFGEQQLEPPGIKLGKWSFTKMMVNSDGYLQDKDGQEIVAEDAYSIRMKSKFYTDMNASMFDNPVMSEFNDINLLARLNAAPSQQLSDVVIEDLVLPDMTDILFKPTDKYIQATSFDMVGANMGGNNSHGNIIGRTNRVISNNTADPSPAETIQDIGVWWGPLFTDGFASSKTLSIKETNKSVRYEGISSYFGGASPLNLSAGDDKSTTGGMFDDRLDFNFYQLPADIGTNASPSGQYGSPIESLSLLTEYEYRANLAQAYDDYRNSVERFSWIATSGDAYSSFYDLEPVTKNKLQLIPMAWAMPSGEASGVVSGIPNLDLLWGNMFSRESEYLPYTFADGVPWDLQVENRPKGEPYGVEYTFRDTDPRGSSYDGANLLAITAGRNTVRIGGGASLQFDASYSLGLPKWTTTTGGQVTPPTILPIGGGLAFGGGTNAIRTYGFPQWGSSSTVLSQVWGGSNLKVKVYDHWPEEDTIYDVRYFQPLHFCAGRIGTAANTIIADSGVSLTDEEKQNWDVKESTLGAYQYERTVDQTSYPVDFRVPTYGDPTDIAFDNSVIPAGRLINRKGVAGSQALEDTTAQIRPVEEWRVNTICRGMMVDENFGFRYMKRVIGINPDDYTIISAGEGFAEGMVFDTELPNDIIIEIGPTSGGALGEDSLIIKDKGQGLLPDRFNKITADNTDAGYGMILDIGTAKVMFHTGIVYDRLEETSHPNKQGSVGCLPKSDGDGGVLMGSKSTTIGISKPNDTNLYDIFFFYVNDVGHVDMYAQPQTAGYIQYVDFDIGAA